MTATPSMTPKTTATSVVLAGLAIAILAFVLPLLHQPSAGAGWRQQAAATGPAPLTAPVQTRGSNSDGIASADAGETSAGRGRN